MRTYFDAAFFAGNRRRLQELFAGKAPIVLTANGLLQRNGDTNFKFRQDSNFWYLTGLDIKDAILVIDQEKEYLILPDIGPVDEVFAAPHNLELIAEQSGIRIIIDQKTGWKKLGSRLRRVKHVATLGAYPAYNEHYSMYSNPARASLIAKMKTANPELELLDLREHLARMRVIKQPAEIKAIQKAVNITVATLKNVERKLPKYINEYEIEADLTYGFRKRGALGHAFSPVVASGPRSCHLHYEDNNHAIDGSRHIYIDTGAEVDHYAADITRTYYLASPSKREAAVVNAVKDVASYAMSNLKPGISIRENEKLVEHYMGEKLRELGLIKSITKESVRKFYTHACSHYLGLDAHDVGDYDSPLQPGMVLTVEPGIYIKDENFGVRIEDDVLVTKKGLKILSKNLNQP